MTNNRNVSVVIATRDRPELLRRAIDAILDQSVQAVGEIVVVFDQSPPDTTLVEISDTVGIRVVENSHASGLAGARNTGIEATTGEWVALCDDDDAWLPDKLGHQFERLRDNPEADFVVGSIVVAIEDKRIPRTTDLTHITVADLVRDRLMAAHPSTFLVRKSAIEGYLGLVDEALPGSYAEDYDWLLRAARGAPILVCNEARTLVQWHAKSYFGSRWEMIDVALEHLVEKTPEFGDDNRGMARILGQRAFAQAALGDRRRALRTSWETFRRDPRQVRALAASAVAVGFVSADRLVRWANAAGRGF